MQEIRKRIVKRNSTVVRNEGFCDTFCGGMTSQSGNNGNNGTIVLENNGHNRTIHRPGEGRLRPRPRPRPLDP